MLPILFEIGPLKIYTFGVFITLAFFWGSFLLWKLVRMSSLKEEDIFDSLFFSLFIALLFGRLVYVIIHINEFGFNIAKIVLINGYPGLSLYGALCGSLLGISIFFAIKKIKLTDAVDYFISPLLLSLAIGKLGSFFSGSEVGTRTSLFLSIKYAQNEGFRHLTPIYESLLFFLGAYFAYRILFLIRKNRYPKRFLLYFFFWYFSMVQFAFDGMKQNKLSVGAFSLNSIISLILLLTFSFYFVYYFRSFIFDYNKKIINSVKHNAKKVFNALRGKAKTTSSQGTKKGA